MAQKILVEVEHVEVHRTKKDKKEKAQFEKFVTEGTEKADELQRQEQCWTKDLYRKREQQTGAARERRSVRSFAVRSQLSLLGRGME